MTLSELTLEGFVTLISYLGDLICILQEQLHYLWWKITEMSYAPDWL